MKFLMDPCGSAVFLASNHLCQIHVAAHSLFWCKSLHEVFVATLAQPTLAMGLESNATGSKVIRRLVIALEV